MKLYTAVLFKEKIEGVPNLHMTHKWFGAVGDSAGTIIKTCSLYFKWAKPSVLGAWCFDHLQFFDENTTVLTNIKLNPFMDLRAELDEFRKDDRKVYVPHVSVAGETFKAEKAIKLPLFLTPDCYAVVGDGEVQAQWKIMNG